MKRKKPQLTNIKKNILLSKEKTYSNSFSVEDDKNVFVD